jgi:hypothetical protein
MKIPYGVSNFGVLRTEGYFYVDKTPFLPQLEEMGARYLLFLRPRRIGKSVFVSLLEHYYDAARADEFDALFGGLWIHEHPTRERNRYLVLSLDFSQLAADGGPEALRPAFFQAVRSRVVGFIARYRDRVPSLAGLEGRLHELQTPEAILGELMVLVREAGQKMYVLIDEYDNFANRILSEGAEDLYESIVQRTGFVRTFYATLKAGTTTGAISRMFITGVSPLVLDDLSSGFNIAAHISNSPRLSTLAGFTRAEVERVLDAFLAARPRIHAQPELGDRGRLLDVLEGYYDGYRFSPDAPERVFNSDMVLYFLSELDDRGRYPTEMLDFNVRTDYRGLQRIGSLAGTARAERRRLLESILGDGYIESDIVRQFGVRSLSSREAFVSLLYYLGMLTLSGEPSGPDRMRLEIPNRVIRELQWEHLAQMLKEQDHIDLDVDDLKAALQKMAVEGDIAPFLELFHERVVKAVGLKDLRRFDEKSLKLMMLAFISLSRLFHPLSEKEFAQGYCDLFLGVSPLYPAARFAWLLELKYLPAGAKAPAIEEAFAQAYEQVARYTSDERLVPLLTQGQALKAGVLVFVGARKVLFRPWPPAAEGSPEGPARRSRAAQKPRKRGAKR